MLDQVSQLVWIFVCIYLSVLLAVVLYNSQPSLHTADYFLAGRDVKWFGVGCSLFAGNFLFEGILLYSAASFLGFLQAKHFVLALCLYVLFTSWLLVPGFRKTGLSSLPEYLERRFHPKLRLYAGGLLLLSFGYIKIALVLVAASSILHTLLGWQMTVSAIFLFSIAGLYVVISGQRTLIRVDILQTIAIIFGMSALIFDRDMVSVIFANISASITASLLPFANSFTNGHSFGFLMVGGLVIVALWFWLGDQHLTQRIVCAKSMSQAKGGSLFAGYLRAVTILLAFPIIFKYTSPLLPQTMSDMGLLPPSYSAATFGFMVIALLAATLSALADSLNSSAFLFVNDFFRKIKPNASDDELLLVGRLGTTALILLSLILIPLAPSLRWPSYLALVAFPAYFWPPLLAIIVLGIGGRAATVRGAAVALLGGFVIAGLRMFLPVGSTGRLPFSRSLLWLRETDSFSFAFFSFLLAALSLLVFSKRAQVGRGAFLEQNIRRLFHKVFEAANDKANRWQIGLSIFFVFVLTVLWTTSFF